MKNILFYYPSNKRTISIESVVIGFKNKGYNVMLLTQSMKSELHEELENSNISTFTYTIEKKNALIYYFKHLVFLIRFCRTNKIDIVYSHLQQGNIISVFAQYFCRAKFYICRHHSSVDGADKNYFQSLFDKIINKLAKLIIVPSKAVYKQVHLVEGVNEKKLKQIYYGYDFSKYPLPDKQVVEKIRNTYNCKLLLVKIARLVPGKRYPILFDVLKKMIFEEHLDIKLLVISDGPLFNEFNDYIRKHKLENHIFLLGNKSNVIDYIDAADAVPLLSEAEASNSVIKEAGLAGKCVIVCEEVGDFGDYIEDNYSGLFVDKMNPSEKLESHLFNLYNLKIDKEALGKNLQKSVLAIFSIDKVIPEYNVLNK